MAIPIRRGAQAAALLGVLVSGLLLLAACGGGAAPAPTAVAQAPAVPTNTALPPTEPPAPTATLAPTDTPAPTATATEAPSPTAVVIADATNCVTCHTSETTLQELAVEEEQAESLSEGEG